MAAVPHTLPPEAAELAAAHRLGALQGTFAPKRLNRALFALYIFTTLHLLAMLVIPGLLFFWWLRRYPDFSRRQAAKRLHLFEHGLVVHPESGDGRVAIRWDSVRLYQDITQKIINGIPTTTEYVYSAVGPGRDHARITHFYEGPETWGPHMQQAILQAQGAAVLESVLAGETVDFGEFSLSRTGLTARGRAYPLVRRAGDPGVGGPGQRPGHRRLRSQVQRRGQRHREPARLPGRRPAPLRRQPVGLRHRTPGAKPLARQPSPARASEGSRTRRITSAISAAVAQSAPEAYQTMSYEPNTSRATPPRNATSAAPT